MKGQNNQGLLLLIVSLLLSGCTKPVQSKNGVDDLFRQYENTQESSPTSRYAIQLLMAIKTQISDTSRFEGKQCTLTIKMAPDGVLLGARTKSGDSDLCDAVLQDLPHVRLPKPPSQEVYEGFKEADIDFKV